MATLSRQLPFQVQFRQGTGSYETRLLIEEFCPLEETSARAQPMVFLTENLPLRLQFQTADKAARLYMDGLESVPLDKLEEDAEGRPFLTPGVHNLFSYDNYAWIPGLYWLEIITNGSQYYALVQVQPKELTMAEWSAMRAELESELRGLALELARRNLGLGPHFTGSLQTELLHRFLVVRHSFPRVMAALTELQDKVNHRVKQSYTWFPEETAQRQNAATVRQLSRRPSASNQALAPKSVLDYDLPENRWVKRIVEVTSAHLRDFLQAVQSYLQEVDEELAEQVQYLHQSNTQLLQEEKLKLRKALLAYQLASERMLRGLQLLRRIPWYQEVGTETMDSLPQALQTDGRYHVLYELYGQLQEEEWQPMVDQSYQYQWKRTDKLYEIWCVIQLCKALSSLGYIPTSGWLYDRDFMAGQLLVPTLPAGTRLIFQAGRNAVHLVYDQEIPRQSCETVPLIRPVYTQDVHNRPDLRLDIYHDEVYAGCLIIDCKYRPLRGFWKAETLTTGYDRPKAMSQLISYGMAIRSPFLNGQRSDWAHHRSQAAIEVWAIYPGSTEETAAELFVADHRVRIFRLRPGLSASLIVDRLAESLGRT